MSPRAVFERASLHPAATSPREKAREKTASRSLSRRLDDFRRWTAGLILDTGDPWDLEDFQAEVVRDVLRGLREVWMVVPEGNAKTTLVAGIALHHLSTVDSAFVPVGASSREQAETLYRQAEGLVLRSDSIRGDFICQEGYRRIRTADRTGRLQIYAADDRTADGVIPTLAILDELHRHRDLRLYRTWRGKLAKRDGQILTISTAGEPGSEFEEARTRILNHASKVRRRRSGTYVRAEAGSLVLHDYAVRDRARARDLRVVKSANPLRAVTPAILREKRDSLSNTDAHWLRFVCNIAAREAGQGIEPEAWDALAEKALVPDRKAWCVGFVDLGWKIDTTAVGILVWESDERRVVTAIRVFEPPVAERDVVAAILDRHEEFAPVGWVYDPNAGGQQMAQQLDRGEHPLQTERGLGPLDLIEHPQDNSLMSLAARRLDEAIRARRIVHDGDTVLRRHALNAVRKSLGGERWRFDRPADAQGARRAKHPIDALTGLLMGHSVAVAEHEEGVSVYERRELLVV